MESEKNIADVYGQFIRVVVEGNDVAIDEKFISIFERFLGRYKAEFESHPEELLSTLRDTEKLLRQQLGRNYYRVFAKNIQRSAFAKELLQKNLDTERSLMETLQHATFASKNLYQHTNTEVTIRLARPRHLLYFMMISMENIMNSINILLPTRDNDFFQGSLLKDVKLLTVRDHWLSMPVHNPTEKDIDVNFIAAVHARKMLEKSFEDEIANIGKTVHLVTNEVCSLNSDIKELAGYFEETANWTKELLEKQASKTQKGAL